MRLGYGVYSVHVDGGLVLLLPLQGEHHFSQGVGDPSPLQDHTGKRVQRAQLLENILPTSSGDNLVPVHSQAVKPRDAAWSRHLGGAKLLSESHSAAAPPGVPQGFLALRSVQVTVGRQVEL